MYTYLLNQNEIAGPDQKIAKYRNSSALIPPPGNMRTTENCFAANMPSVAIIALDGKFRFAMDEGLYRSNTWQG